MFNADIQGLGILITIITNQIIAHGKLSIIHTSGEYIMEPDTNTRVITHIERVIFAPFRLNCRTVDVA